VEQESQTKKIMLSPPCSYVDKLLSYTEKSYADKSNVRRKNALRMKTRRQAANVDKDTVKGAANLKLLHSGYQSDGNTKPFLVDRQSNPPLMPRRPKMLVVRRKGEAGKLNVHVGQRKGEDGKLNVGGEDGKLNVGGKDGKLSVYLPYPHTIEDVREAMSCSHSHILAAMYKLGDK
jgi:hypothetical protein